MNVPMGDDTIRAILPNANILTYAQLKDYNNLHEILNKNYSYLFLLYLDSKTTGHWVVMSKYDDIIEFFDPYGLYPDKQLAWIPEKRRENLKVDTNHLTRLFNNTDKVKFIYNTTKWQKEDPYIQTCGRHCVYRIVKLLDNFYDLEEYKNHMNKLKKNMGVTFDEIVTTFINY